MKKLILLFILMASQVFAMSTWENNYSATVTTIDGNPTYFMGVTVPPDSSGVFRVTAVARESSTNDSKIWSQVYAIKRIGFNAPTVSLAGGNQTDPIGDAGAVSWTFSTSTTDWTMSVFATGQAGKTIDWYGHVAAYLLAE